MHVSYTWHSPPSAADVVTCPCLVTAGSCHRSRSCLRRHRRKPRPQRCRVWGLWHSHKHRDQYMTVTCDQWHPEEPVTSDSAEVVSRTIITRLVNLFIFNEWMQDVLVLTDQNWSWGLVSWVMRIVMFWLFGFLTESHTYCLYKIISCYDNLTTLCKQGIVHKSVYRRVLSKWEQSGK